jgi:hypothetical protein
MLFGFDKESAARIAHVVRRVETMPIGDTGGRSQATSIDESKASFVNNTSFAIPKGGIVQCDDRDAAGNIVTLRPEYGGLANLGVTTGATPPDTEGWMQTRGIVKLAVENISKAKIGSRLGSKMNSFYAIPDESGTFLVLAILTDREALTAPAGYAICMFTRHRGDYTYARDCKGTTRVRVASQVWILSPQLVATELQPGVVEISCP